MKAHSSREFVVPENEIIYCSRPLFPVSVFHSSLTTCHTPQESHVCCFVISQGSRPSLEDPDTGHENDHEPKLTCLALQTGADLSSSSSSSRSSSSPLIHDNLHFSLLLVNRWGSICCKNFCSISFEWEFECRPARFLIQQAHLDFEPLAL